MRGFPVCHVERSEAPLAVTFAVTKRPNLEILLPHPRDQNDNAGYSSTLQPSKLISSTSSSAPGTGTARNRNCPACKNLRRFGVNLAGAQRSLVIVAGANRLRRDVLQLFQAVDSTTAPEALRILPKRLCSRSSEPANRVPSRMETAHSPGYRRYESCR